MKIRVGAIAKDGTYSTATGRGACSHHGGVKQWVYQTVPVPSRKTQSQTSQRSIYSLSDYSYSSSYTKKVKQQKYESRTYEREKQPPKVLAKQPIKQQIYFTEQQVKQMFTKLVQQELKDAQNKKKNNNKLNKSVCYYTYVTEQKWYSLKKIRQFLRNQSQMKKQKNKIQKQLRYTFNPKKQSIPKKMWKIQKNTINGCVYPIYKRKNNHIQSQTIQFVSQTNRVPLKATIDKRQSGKIVSISQSKNQKKQQIVMKSLNNEQKSEKMSKYLQVKMTPMKNSNQNKTQSQEIMKKQASIEVKKKNELNTIKERQIKNKSQKIQTAKHIQTKDNKQGNILMAFLILLIIVLVPLQLYKTNRYL